MNIRPALESDALGIARVHVYTWQAAYRGVISDAYLEALSVAKRESGWRKLILRGTPEIWVADAGSELIGWAAFGSSRDMDAASNAGELEAIYVLQSSWAKGIGRDLWITARRRLVQRGFQSATLWVLKANLRAIRFYRAAGFEEDSLSEREIVLGAQKLQEVRYIASLANRP
jgi:ribosomal protein S18 acetylase RimI-like enzyme